MTTLIDLCCSRGETVDIWRRSLSEIDEVLRRAEHPEQNRRRGPND